MIKVIQVPLYLKPSQVTVLDKQLAAHRSLYNSCLAKHIEFYKAEGKSVGGFTMIKDFIPAKMVEDASLGLDWIKLCNYSSLQQTVRRLNKTFTAFFKSCKGGVKRGFPRFKNRDRFCTIEYSKHGDGWKIKGDSLYIQHLGMVKMAGHCNIKNSVRMSITKRGGKVFASFTVEETGVTLPASDKSIGLDFGLKTFVTTSEGEKIESPKFHKATLKQEAKLHRRIHKAEKGSKARAKAKRSLQTHKRKEANRRKNFNHQLSRKLVNNYKVIVTEDLTMKDFVSDIKNINRSYADVAWGQFTQFLRYKAENAGRVFIKVNPAYTTQECSSCGSLAPKLLTERWHECSCGYKEDRDINAAKNILRRGLASLGLPKGE